MSAISDRTGGVEAWDTEWAAERAAEALLYLGRNYPECLENLRDSCGRARVSRARGRDAWRPGPLSAGPLLWSELYTARCALYP